MTEDSKTNTSPATKSTFMLNFLSYRNHVVYISVYMYILVSGLGQLMNHPYYNDGHRLSLSLAGKTSWTHDSSWIWLLLCHGTVLSMLFFLYLELRYVVRRRKLPPGDSGWPILGHFVHSTTDPDGFHVSRIKTFGPMSTYSLFGINVILITDDEDIQWSLAQERKGNTAPKVLPHFIELIGTDSIFLKSGEGHKRMRKIFGPVFTPIAIKDYAKAMDDVIQTELGKLSRAGRYHTSREWALLAMRVFFHCAFGKVNEERMDKLARNFEGWISGFRSFPIRIPGLGLARAHHCKEELFKVFREMIDEYKALYPPPSKGDGDCDNSNCQNKSVLGRIIYSVDEDGNMPSEKTLLDNLLFFTFAGFDTTKASFGAITHYLQRYPKAEEALREEISGFSGQELDVDRLKYEAPVLNAVMAEIFRLAAPLAGHTTSANVDLTYKGYAIPKGTFIQADVQAHNILNEKLYPAASEFHFERWLPKDHPLFDDRFAIKEKIDYNVMSTKFRSFNMGQHMCLGGHFAKMEIRIVIVRLLQQYNFEIRNEKIAKFPMYQITNEFKLSRRQEM